MDLVLAVAVVHHGGGDHEAEGDAELKKRMVFITIQSGKFILPVKNFSWKELYNVSIHVSYFVFFFVKNSACIKTSFCCRKKSLVAVGLFWLSLLFFFFGPFRPFCPPLFSPPLSSWGHRDEDTIKEGGGTKGRREEEEDLG